MTPIERRLFQAWAHQYLGHGKPDCLYEAMIDALDTGVDVEAVMDAATAHTDGLRERAYRRAETARLRARKG